jgi:hypothetical protein
MEACTLCRNDRTPERYFTSWKLPPDHLSALTPAPTTAAAAIDQVAVLQGHKAQER